MTEESGQKRVVRDEVSKVVRPARVSLVLLYKDFDFHWYVR